MTFSRSSQSTPRLKPEDLVLTPSGRVAEVVNVYPDVDEALVQWTSGDRARFKLGQLRKI
jgi:hypothetical protein